MFSQRVRGATELDTYFAASITFSATASATDVFVFRGPPAPAGQGLQQQSQPNANFRIARLLRICFSGVQTTAGNVPTVFLNKHSIANTGGASSSVTAVAADSGTSRPAASTLLVYTANPIVDASAVTIWAPRVLIPAAATTDESGVIFDFDCRDLLNGKPLTLRGANEEIAINLGGVVPSGLAGLQVSCIWTEEQR